jgi:hypothetical protein
MFSKLFPNISLAGSPDINGLTPKKLGIVFFQVVSVQWEPLLPPFFEASGKDAMEKPECPDIVSNKEKNTPFAREAGEGGLRVSEGRMRA